ncbi:hypothetical protein [Clostridium botulinum]|uniref:hypothetical protein n=1 Tax=Clostridium botulinum TaxID=1491 RepID=UPI001C9B2C2B|nr:hypothetical protein [Clostridium botulinum]MBY6860762.1 hypothetical protein [Clostridium botulinum]MBY7043849.1 hypothetical protein [Clostridium botulinum]
MLRYRIEAVSERAVQTFGAAHQKVKAIEELGELIQALSKDLLHCDHNAPEEIADVEIMIAQLRYMFDTDEIDKIKEEKLRKLAGVVVA